MRLTFTYLRGIKRLSNKAVIPPPTMNEERVELENRDEFISSVLSCLGYTRKRVHHSHCSGCTFGISSGVLH